MATKVDLMEYKAWKRCLEGARAAGARSDVSDVQAGQIAGQEAAEEDEFETWAEPGDRADERRDDGADEQAREHYAKALLRYLADFPLGPHNRDAAERTERLAISLQKRKPALADQLLARLRALRDPVMPPLRRDTFSLAALRSRLSSAIPLRTLHEKSRDHHEAPVGNHEGESVDQGKREDISSGIFAAAVTLASDIPDPAGPE